MEQRKLPNATTALVLSIISFIACCISMGIGGIILSAIALVLTNRDKKRFAEAPEEYNNYGQVKTARILAVIGLILGILSLIYVVFSIVSQGGWSAYVDNIQQVIEQAKQAQEK